MEMIWSVLQACAFFGVLLLALAFCVQYTGQWSLGNRCIIVWTRFTTVGVFLVLLALVWSSLVASGRSALLAVEQGVHASALHQVPVLALVPTPPPAAAPASSAGGTSVLGGPSLSVEYMDRVLSAHGSPAVGTAWALYSLSQRYGVDDAFALAFFWHESNFGMNGEAAKTHSLGNLRCIADAACVDLDRGGYASFPDWPSGYAAWYRLIVGPVYVGAGRTTVESIIPVYAPAADSNNEAAYIANVTSVVYKLRAGRLDL
jgi:hypothetical protein